MSITLDKETINKIELIDKLREKFSPEDNRKLKLPQIIVVGDQSSGKSSILEAISGVKLPKGVNTVTRCPIVIQMRKSENKVTRIKYNNVDETITDTEKEIKEVQRRVFGDKLTKEPITIIVESPNLNTLTMIDLPGIIKAETTDQVTFAKEKTVEIAKFYMEQENSLIICVLPGNQDICTTTTIGLAQECNKDKSRIIVGLTKLDKLDAKEQTLIPDILSNIKLPVKKGYFGLVVSDDILEASIADRSKLEEEKFKLLYFWENFKEQLGLKKFESVLVKELTLLINKTLPILRTNISNLIKEKQSELLTFSKYSGGQEFQFPYIIDCQKKLNHTIDAILCKADEEIIKLPCMQKYLEENDLLDPVKKNDTFLYFWHETFKSMYEEFNFIFKEFFKLKESPYNNPQVLEDYINRSRTENSSLFISSKPFKSIVDDILCKFNEKSSECVEKCNQLIYHMIETVLVMDIDDEHNSMKNDIQTYGKEVLEKQKLETIQQLKYLFESEKFYFSQEDIRNPCGDEDNTVSQVTPILQMPTQLPGNISSSMVSILPQSIQSGPLNTVISNGQRNMQSEPSNISKNTSDEKSSQEEKCRNGMRLKKHLERYVTGLMGRLGDAIPNFIRLSLFVRFKEELNTVWILKVFNPEIYPSYFNISEERRNVYHKLKESIEHLNESLVELDRLGSKRNGYR